MLAEVRPTELWTTAGLVGGFFLLGALVVLAVFLVTRRR
jgi:hypothetical protein